ncbi:MAG: hypothetical protein AAGB31_00210 [Bdellovibrio sp.]
MFERKNTTAHMVTVELNDRVTIKKEISSGEMTCLNQRLSLVCCMQGCAFSPAFYVSQIAKKILQKN